MTVLQIFGMSLKNTIKTNAAIKSTVVVMRIKITNWSDCKTNLSLQTYLSVDPLFFYHLCDFTHFYKQAQQRLTFNCTSKPAT